MTRITATARRSVITGLAIARDQHRRLYADGRMVDGEPRAVHMNHLDVCVDVLVRHGFEVEAMSHAQIDGLLVEFDHMEARDASNARIGLVDRRVAMAPTGRVADAPR